MNDKLPDAFKVNPDEHIEAREYEIVYAIIKPNIENGSKPKIPFFSKVTFRIVKNRLERYGYKISVIGIEKEE